MNPTYTFGTASMEIIILLLLAFLLGMFLCWLLRKMGLCCTVDTSADYGYKNRPIPREGGYTADINSLLRTSGNDVPARPRTSEIPRSATTAVSDAAATATSVAASIAGIGGGRKDDLKKLEGIGPKIEQVLNTAGIQNFEQLAAMTPDAIKPLLEAAGSQFRMHDPNSWPYQAELAAKGEWARLQEYQNLLINGQQ